jgi:hypothetical protein
VALVALALFSETERTQQVQVIEIELIYDWQNLYLLAPPPDGMISDPSTKIARQCQSANGREQIAFPLGLTPRLRRPCSPRRIAPDRSNAKCAGSHFLLLFA